MTVTINDGHTFGKWISNGDGTHTRKCTVDGCTTGIESENCRDADKDHKCDLCGKKLTDHTGGKATCKDKAICEVCGETYGEFDTNNHTDLKHIDAKTATRDTEGDIEYWYCDGCGKFYSDEAADKEIDKKDIVINKLADESNNSRSDSPQTDSKKDTTEDSTNSRTHADGQGNPNTGVTGGYAFGLVLVALSGGAVTIMRSKKKRSQ